MTVDAQGIHIGWDEKWPLEDPFQAMAVYLARKLAGQRIHLLDTSKLPGGWKCRAGAPDITACVSGRYVAVELKGTHGKQILSQQTEQEVTENALGEYVIARTLREVFDALEIEVPE